MKYSPQYTEIDCIDKHLRTLFALCKRRVLIEFDKTRIIYGVGGKPYKISPQFFRSIKCVGCGQCCRRYHLVWDKKPEHILTTHARAITVNEKQRILAIQAPSLEKSHCELAFQQPDQRTWRCKDYGNRPLLSRMPHIAFKETDKDIIITKRQFGRNWALKCQAQIKPFSKDDLYGDDIPTLLYIRDICKVYYGIDTQVDKIVDDLIRESGRRI